MSPQPLSLRHPKIVSPQATASVVEEGPVNVTVENFDTAHLIDRDVTFVLPNTIFSYWAEAHFTKFMYVSVGGGWAGSNADAEWKELESGVLFEEWWRSSVKRGFKL
ncbi:Nn.00g011130.m01.CDS01 [Neocucurbitaria sp. VM-36]